MNAKNVVSESKQSAKGAKMPHSFKKKKKKKPLYEALSCKYTFFSLCLLCFFSVHFFSFCLTDVYSKSCIPLSFRIIMQKIYIFPLLCNAAL